MSGVEHGLHNHIQLGRIRKAFRAAHKCTKAMTRAKLKGEFVLDVLHIKPVRSGTGSVCGRTKYCFL